MIQRHEHVFPVRLLLFCMVLLLAPGCARSPASCPRSAQLYNLNASTRIPGEYIVIFRSPTALTCISNTELKSLRVLPGVIPDSKANSRRLAQALAQSVAAKLISVSDVGLPDHFLIVTSDRTIRTLAHDPRIASIEANLRTKLQLPKE